MRKDEESERDVAMLPGGHCLTLSLQHGQRIDDPRPCLGRKDHLVDVAPRGGDVRIGKALLVFRDEARAFRIRIGPRW